MPGSSNRSNPLAEINFRTDKESSDVSTIVLSMVKPEGKQKGREDPFWDNCASNLLYCVIMHLMYKHHKENLPLPSPTDIMSFLSSPDKDTNELFDDMMTYQHISPDEFLEREHNVVKLDYLGNPCKNPDGSPVFVQKVNEKGEPVTDKDGNPVYEREKYSNPLREIYGEYYVRDLKKINDVLTNMVNVYLKRMKNDEREKIAQAYPEMVTKEKIVYTFKSMAKTISEIRDNIRWGKADATDAEIQEALQMAQAADFVKEKDGWKIWHVVESTDLVCEAGEDYSKQEVYHNYETDPVDREFGTPTIKKLVHNTDFNWWDDYPFMPEPYDTWSDEISYGPEGYKRPENYGLDSKEGRHFR